MWERASAPCLAGAGFCFSTVERRESMSLSLPLSRVHSADACSPAEEVRGVGEGFGVEPRRVLQQRTKI